VLLLQCLLQAGVSTVHGEYLELVSPEVVGQHRAELYVIVNKEDLFQGHASQFQRTPCSHQRIQQKVPVTRPALLQVPNP
jgi:hypothetical protein